MPAGIPGAVRYDISHDPGRGRWYIDASWKAAPAPAPAPSLDELGASPVVAVDVNVGHLAVAVVAADGNVLRTPVTIGLDLAGLPAATRDGRLRAAISALIITAKAHGAPAIVAEDLNFSEARSEGRERHENRPSRGRRGRGFRRAISGIPTGKLCDRLTQMAGNAGLSVIVVDPAYTSSLNNHSRVAGSDVVAGHSRCAKARGRPGLMFKKRQREEVRRAVQHRMSAFCQPQAEVMGAEV